MKTAPFAVSRPLALAEVLSLKAEHGDDARLLAGGQSLVPLMRFRLVKPGHLIDLSALGDLAYIEDRNGHLAIGAMTRQRVLERSYHSRETLPLLREAIAQIGHPAIRNRGTVGGSLAHADPSAELSLVAAALGAELVLASQGGERVLRADAFFVSHLATAIRPDEVLAEVRLPLPRRDHGWAMLEIAQRHGDFALVSVAALLTRDATGVIDWTRLAIGGVGPTPIRAHAAERALLGQLPSEAAFQAAAALAVEDIEPPSDLHASSAYRRHAATVLCRRALAMALERANHRTQEHGQ